MRTSVALLVGLALGSVVAPGFAQGDRLGGVHGVNHIAISVEHFDEALAFYTGKMGFHEAFTVRDDKGQPVLAYVQVSRDTFVELLQATPARKPGIDHFGLHVDDIRASLGALKARGVTAEDQPRASRAKSLIANVTDPNGVKIELSELGPDALARKASESWK